MIAYLWRVIVSLLTAGGQTTVFNECVLRGGWVVFVDYFRRPALLAFAARRDSCGALRAQNISRSAAILYNANRS
jgi:hypothetical protein